MQALQIEIHADADALVQRGIELWQSWSAAAIAARGRFTVALSGGSTPKRYYAELAKTPDLDWQNTLLCWGDERYVPPDHPDSNYRMTRESLLDHVRIPQVLPAPTQAGDPAQDAQAYEQDLRQAFQAEWPDFDLMLLGLGEDGHTASLFPGTAALEVTDRWVTVGYKGTDPRLTLTLPVLNHSRQVVFLVAGSSKASRIQEILTTDPHLPAQWVRPSGRLLWLLDAAAAAQLPFAAALVS